VTQPKLVIEIALGNDAMVTPANAQSAILAAFGAQTALFELFELGHAGAINDVNGNYVGAWKVVES
jgi:hypothetical protein